MITFKKATEKELKRVLLHPTCFYKITGRRLTTENIPATYMHNLAVVRNKKHLMGIIGMDRFCEDAFIMHGAILPKFCKPSLLEEFWNHFSEFVKKNSQFKKIIGAIPVNCSHTITCLKKWGFKEEGRLGGIGRWGGESQDMLLLTYTIDRNDNIQASI